mmetsp:Transcript_14438/g.25697  ORF Transcript_14438/g.25697 Transcript_14438/m.25697 type:complete len:129 (+) Transcript_14438:507-893(+)
MTMVVPGALLLLLLMPLPRKVQNVLVTVCDKMLFLRPHPYLNLSVFWLYLLISVGAFLFAVMSMHKAREHYVMVRGVAGDALEPRVKLLAAERNVWITGSAWVLWVLLHRFRSLQRRYNQLLDQVKTE